MFGVNRSSDMFGGGGEKRKICEDKTTVGGELFATDETAAELRSKVLARTMVMDDDRFGYSAPHAQRGREIHYTRDLCVCPKAYVTAKLYFIRGGERAVDPLRDDRTVSAEK